MPADPIEALFRAIQERYRSKAGGELRASSRGMVQTSNNMRIPGEFVSFGLPAITNADYTSTDGVLKEHDLYPVQFDSWTDKPSNLPAVRLNGLVKALYNNFILDLSAFGLTVVWANKEGQFVLPDPDKGHHAGCVIEYRIA